MANDEIVTADGNDIVLGDSGYATFTDAGRLETISSDLTEVGQTVSATDIGGDDDITTGEGNDIAFGGTGSDFINVTRSDNSTVSDSGNDLLVGDNATAHFVDADGNDTLTTIAFGDGASDSIYTDNGAEVVLGGDSSDTITTGTDSLRDVVAGDNADLVFTTNGDGRFDTARLKTVTSTDTSDNTTDNDTILSLIHI